MRDGDDQGMYLSVEQGKLPPLGDGVVQSLADLLNLGRGLFIESGDDLAVGVKHALLLLASFAIGQGVRRGHMLLKGHDLELMLDLRVNNVRMSFQ